MSEPTPPSAIRVADAMRTPVLTCGPETPVREVARIMVGAGVHAVIVCGIERTPWSAVTALDLIATPLAEADARTARDIEQTEALTVPAGATLGEAARHLVEHDLDHAIVVDEDGVPVGVLSSLDLVRRLT